MSNTEPDSQTPLISSPTAPSSDPLVPAADSHGISAEQRQWAMIAHLSALIGGVVTGGWGHSLACFVGPLIVWLLKKDSMPFVDDQGKEALNFNITVGIVFLALTIFTVMTFGIGILIVWPAYLLVALGWLVLSMVAAYKAYHGIAYRYPVCLRLIK
ncbi:MAG: DUF4870 domain-containing protein [Lysobacteraceae bacterium]